MVCLAEAAVPGGEQRGPLLTEYGPSHGPAPVASPSLSVARHIPVDQSTFVFLFKGAITSKIKHAIKHKKSPAQMLQPSVAFCFSLQPMTAYDPVLDGTPS